MLAVEIFFGFFSIGIVATSLTVSAFLILHSKIDRKSFTDFGYRAISREVFPDVSMSNLSGIEVTLFKLIILLENPNDYS